MILGTLPSIQSLWGRAQASAFSEIPQKLSEAKHRWASSNLVQRGEVTWPSAHSNSRVEQGIEVKSSDF